MKKRTNLDAPTTKRDLDEAVGQIVGAISKTLEGYATKEDLKRLASKEDLKAVEKRLGDKIDDLGADVADHRRRIRDLEIDTITRREFKVKVLPR